MSKVSADLQRLIDQIISIHGEDGVCPTRKDWETILQYPSNKPVGIVNLLKFHARLDKGDEALSGAEAYQNYMQQVSPAFAGVGGKQVYYGQAGCSFSSSGDGDWDTVIITEYPTPIALAEFWLDEGFINAHSHRVDGVQKSQVIVIKPA